MNLNEEKGFLSIMEDGVGTLDLKEIKSMVERNLVVQRVVRCDLESISCLIGSREYLVTGLKDLLIDLKSDISNLSENDYLILELLGGVSSNYSFSECDICGSEEVMFDASSKNHSGQWGCFCKEHFMEHGITLALGKGQLLLPQGHKYFK